MNLKHTPFGSALSGTRDDVEVWLLLDWEGWVVEAWPILFSDWFWLPSFSGTEIVSSNQSPSKGSESSSATKQQRSLKNIKTLKTGTL